MLYQLSYASNSEACLQAQYFLIPLDVRDNYLRYHRVKTGATEGSRIALARRRNPLHSRLAVWFAVIALAANAILYAYLELIDYALLNPVLRVLAIIFCPMSVLGSSLLIDVNPHSMEERITFGIFGIVNAVLYYGIGTLAAGYVRKLK